MAEQVTINIRGDASNLKAEIDESLTALSRFAASAVATNKTAVSAVRESISAEKEWLGSINANTDAMNRLNTVTRTFEDRVNSAGRQTARAAESGARGFAILASSAGASVRNVDMLIASVANMGLGMTGMAAYVGAGAIALFGLVRLLNESRDAAEKAREELDKLAFDDNFSAAQSKQHELEFQMIEDSRKLYEARVQEAVVNGLLGGSLEGLAVRAEKLIGIDQVGRATKALKQIQDELAQVDAITSKQAAEEDAREKAHEKVIEDERKQREAILKARREEAALAREIAQQDKEIAKFARDLHLDMTTANDQPLNPNVKGAAEAAPGSRTRPIHVTAAKLPDAMQQLIAVNGRLGASFVLWGNQAADAFEKTFEWSKLAANSITGITDSVVNALAGKGTFKQIEQAMAEPWVKALEARAEYDFAMALSNWPNPAVAAKYLESAAGDIAGAVAISRIMDLGGSGGGGHSGGAGGGGNASAQSAKLGAGNGAYQQPIIPIYVTGELKMDGRTVANLNSKLTRINDRGAPARAVL